MINFKLTSRKLITNIENAYGNHFAIFSLSTVNICQRLPLTRYLESNRIGFNADPDPGSQTNAGPDPNLGQTLTSQKIGS
jgi:hypothetical protein